MRDELVSRELAALLKEKGFDWKYNKCFEFLEGSPLNDGVEKTTNSLVNWNAIGGLHLFLLKALPSVGSGKCIISLLKFGTAMRIVLGLLTFGR